MKLFRNVCVCMGLMFFSFSVLSGGIITQINVSGPSDPHHPNVVQISIEGGFNAAEGGFVHGACDPTLAAIRSTDDYANLVAYAITKSMTAEPVSVVLNSSDKYFANRCTVARISNAD